MKRHHHPTALRERKTERLSCALRENWPCSSVFTGVLLKSLEKQYAPPRYPSPSSSAALGKQYNTPATPALTYETPCKALRAQAPVTLVHWVWKENRKIPARGQFSQSSNAEILNSKRGPATTANLTDLSALSNLGVTELAITLMIRSRFCFLDY